MTDGLVGDGELAKVVSHHLGLDLNAVHRFAWSRSRAGCRTDGRRSTEDTKGQHPFTLQPAYQVLLYMTEELDISCTAVCWDPGISGRGWNQTCASIDIKSDHGNDDDSWGPQGK